jgi:hypothetical protein
MRMALCVLCMAMCSAIARAQDQHVSNFEACVSEAREKRSETTMENYTSWKCVGAIAQRLAVRPDQCPADVKPPLRNVSRTSRQLDDGFYLRVVWWTGICAGQCETRIYNDARDSAYMCEVRRHAEARGLRNGGPPLRPNYYRRYNDYPPYQPGPPRRWDYHGPAVRSYPPGPDAFRRGPDPEREVRVTGRGYSIPPGWHLEYRYDDYPGDRRRDDGRWDDNRDEAYLPPRVEYYRGDYRRDDYRPD